MTAGSTRLLDYFFREITNNLLTRMGNYCRPVGPDRCLFTTYNKCTKHNHVIKTPIWSHNVSIHRSLSHLISSSPFRRRSALDDAALGTAPPLCPFDSASHSSPSPLLLGSPALAGLPECQRADCQAIEDEGQCRLEAGCAWCQVEIDVDPGESTEYC